jgi:hypothetical protein
MKIFLTTRLARRGTMSPRRALAGLPARLRRDMGLPEAPMAPPMPPLPFLSALHRL